MNPRIPYLRDKTKKLPMEPGVYIMRDSSKHIIYIGKAKLLRNRVSSYFRSIEKHLEKVYRMVMNVYDFDYIVTGSEFEALVLECSMIKQHKPKYNILLKDDKGFHYIHVSGGDFPRVTAEKMQLGDGKNLGPYTSSYVVKNTVDEVTRAFMLPTCKKKFPQDFKKGRPCLNYHIKQCMGLCRGKISKEDYGEIIGQCMEFMNGGSKSTMELMEQQMQKASDNLDFEKAADIRDRIRSIKRITDHQNVMFTQEQNLDVVALVQNAEECAAAILKLRGQRLVDKQDFDLGGIESLESARSSFLLSYYGQQADIPKEIAIDGEFEDAVLVQRYIAEKAGHKVTIVVPSRGEKLRLIKMTLANAAEQIARKSERTGREVTALDELARLLGLERPPAYIEAYDISNLGSETVVGGMVAFENGRPLKSAYKKFNIKTVAGTDDYACMREVVGRRLSHYEEEKESGEGFGRLPDLILLDGGKGHVSAVEPLVAEMGFSIPIFGMVKDDSHRTRAIACDGGEIAINSTRSAFTLVSTIQDEVHRFSIAHMKAKHKKGAFALSLVTVPGIGEKRAQALFAHFKTQAAMKSASQEELAACSGMNKNTAEALHKYFHEGEV